MSESADPSPQPDFAGRLRASELVPREAGVVCGFADSCFAQRYMCMGVRVGSRVELVRRAPFGRACYLRVDGRHLAVRKEEAACLLLQRHDPSA